MSGRRFSKVALWGFRPGGYSPASADPDQAFLDAAEAYAGEHGRSGAPATEVRLRGGVRVYATCEQLAEARAWMLDCQWQEDPEDLEELSNEDVVRGVDRHVEGGWLGFVAAADVV